MDNEKYDLDRLVSSIMADYEKYPGNEIVRYLPNKTEVTRLIGLLRKLLFPGYFNEYNSEYTKYSIGNLLIEAESILQRQICLALNIESTASEDCKHKFEQAANLSGAFLKKLPEIRNMLHTDVDAAFDGDPAAQSKHEIIFAYPGIAAITIYRLAHELYSLSVPLIPRIMTEYAHSKTGIDIHPGAEIGKRFFIDHGTGVVIGETTEIGDYVKIYQGVTLGALSTRGGQSLHNVKRHPTLEDNVTVYSGASILGGSTVIGKNCIIGGNTFITESVSADTKVSMKNPALNFKTN